MKICFVILHYNAINETETCIESIKAMDEAEKKIIVVDNASPNHTGHILAERYQKDADVDIVLNDTNLGFAKGNNVGYRYAKEKYNADFIVLVNSDIIFIQNDFVKKLYQIYEEVPFALLGPDILNSSETTHSNPLNDRAPSLIEAKKWLRGFKRQLFKTRVKLFLSEIHLKKYKSEYSLNKQSLLTKKGGGETREKYCSARMLYYCFEEVYRKDGLDFLPGNFPL